MEVTLIQNDTSKEGSKEKANIKQDKQEASNNIFAYYDYK